MGKIYDSNWRRGRDGVRRKEESEGMRARHTEGNAGGRRVHWGQEDEVGDVRRGGRREVGSWDSWKIVAIGGVFLEAIGVQDE